MKISTRGRYGLTVVVELGRHYGKGPIPLRQIAATYDLSEAYLEQLVPPLRNSGLVKSVRGAYGGYKLARDPETITAGDVIRLLEGPIQVVEGIEDGKVEQKKLWHEMSEAIRHVLDTTTIADLLLEEEPQVDEGYMFYI
ncbi:Rrf2 family transcriptional regulator [Savagea sp. SN6]|uniref:Rrf2 family transcriptional regulator n=1 Tax=Savagea serpentis TaxID=2785297 RepID=A0A8J7G0X1_9BACL|nr:Rrf2 family transcriptional regulator [Savagea serpentis]MBF4500125.1 Rrf2 family transcriptional regulator [Savagea serpentis]